MADRAASGHRHAFLEVIKDDPENDTPRLVFADWLEEHGEPERAQFIRLQCRAASLDADDAERAGLAAAALDLWRRFRPVWLGPLEPLEADRGDPTSRGMLNLRANPQRLSSLPEDVFASEAFRWVEGLIVEGPPEEALRRVPASEIVTLHLRHWPTGDLWRTPIAPPADLGRFTRLRTLELTMQPSPAWAAALQVLPRLIHLRTDLWRDMPNWFEPLVSSPLLNRLERLEVHVTDNNGDASEYAALRTLLNRPDPTRLTELSVSLLGGAQAKVLPLLFASVALTGVSSLTLQGSWTVEALRGLKKIAPGFPLRNLTLGQLSDAGLRELVKSPLLGGLERLSVQSCSGTRASPLQASSAIDHRGVAALAGSPLASRLRFLNLNGVQVGPEGAKALAASRHFTCLTHLCAGLPKPVTAGSSPGRIGATAAALLSSPSLSQLTRLNLSGQDAGPEAIEALADSGVLVSLVDLNLAFNPIGDRGAKALARWRGLNNLAGLCLLGAGLGDEGAVALAESPHLKPTTWLTVGENRIKERGQRALRQRLSDHVVFTA
jgi:uncharacterized protein (TIGR02996 family)